MPTHVQDDLFVHTCQYCGHQQTDSRHKKMPFLFTGYRCTKCGRPLDDLDHDLLVEKSISSK
jgi:DNA-directed RNA polymerase subunit RPC12/RpoP